MRAGTGSLRASQAAGGPQARPVSPRPSRGRPWALRVWSAVWPALVGVVLGVVLAVLAALVSFQLFVWYVTS